MKYSKLGTSDLNVSRCCLGTMTWGKQNTEAEAHEQMDYALEHGVNFWDTAELYAVPPEAETQGKTEEYMGAWFAKAGRREDVILATKIAGPVIKNGPGAPWIRDGEDISGEAIKRALEGSLKRLQTDYVDLYQLHWPNRPNTHFSNSAAGRLKFTDVDTQKEIDTFMDVLQTVDALIKQGKIRHFGLSDDSAWGIMKYLELSTAHNLPRVVSIQNEFSLLKRFDDPYVTETCVREDVAYLPWSPLAGGCISGKYLNGARPEGTRWAISGGRYDHRSNQAAENAIKSYIDIANKHGLDVCQMALAFCDQQSFVTSTIIGATTMEQLKSDIDAFDITLSEDVMAEIDQVYRQYPMPF